MEGLDDPIATRWHLQCDGCQNRVSRFAAGKAHHPIISARIESECNGNPLITLPCPSGEENGAATQIPFKLSENTHRSAIRFEQRHTSLRRLVFAKEHQYISVKFLTSHGTGKLNELQIRKPTIHSHIYHMEASETTRRNFHWSPKGNKKTNKLFSITRDFR